MKKVTTFVLFTLVTFAAGAQIAISGYVQWDTMSLNAEVSLDMASTGLRLPSGRTHGESLLNAGFHNLIRAHLMDLQVDSSSTIGDLVNQGELSIREIDAFAAEAAVIPPSMSPDLRRLFSLRTISLNSIGASLVRHTRPMQVPRTLNPVSTAGFTGIVIIANEELPIHGMRGTALPVPSFFPKIWDNEMNLIYYRNMVYPHIQGLPIVHYSPIQGILQNNPTGLTPELRQVVGDRPLRIFAQGVFGIRPTDIIIDRNDALLIISSEENRRLLSQGRVAIILNESVLRSEFN